MTTAQRRAERLRPALTTCTIMVVDDVLASQRLIAASLARAGFQRVLTAADGRRALEMLQGAAPDLLLLDLLMPDVDGFEVCETLRRQSRFDDLPIIAMTALEDADERARAFAVGATDLILKPIHLAELVARTTIHLERLLLIRGLRDFNERTATELATAREMQVALLPDVAVLRRIADRHGIAVAAMLTPSAELGGDLWGMWSIDATRFGVYAVDISGHGTIAAINTFRLHTLLADGDLDRADPGGLLAAVNDRLAGLLAPGQYATMVYAVVDTVRDVIRYAAAGCPCPVIAVVGAAPQELDGSGVPLGIEAGTHYPTREAAFGPGTRLLLHSDALPEALLPGGVMMGDARASALVAAALLRESPQAVIDELSDSIAATVGPLLDDDLTLVCLAR